MNAAEAEQLIWLCLPWCANAIEDLGWVLGLALVFGVLYAIGLAHAKLDIWWQSSTARKMNRRIIQPLSRQDLSKFPNPADTSSAMAAIESLPRLKHCESRSGTSVVNEAGQGSSWSVMGLTDPDAALVLARVIATALRSGLKIGCLLKGKPEARDATVFLAREWYYTRGRVGLMKESLVDTSSAMGIQLRMANEGSSFVVEMKPTYLSTALHDDANLTRNLVSKTATHAGVLQQNVVHALQRVCPEAIP